MRKMLTTSALAGVMTFGFAATANAAALYAPAAGAKCVTFSGGSVTVTPAGGVIIVGNTVAIGPPASCL